MYTTTFYSYKGGVGRTMALANVAFELASRGRTVLMVDFDLEAPGLESFVQKHGHSPRKGIVDFVNDYIRTGEAPDASEYLAQLAAPTKDLWFMGAGRRDAGYESRLHEIDWRRLYADLDGYLLFEDLKAQWEHHLSPDYVFIDSRTGHTDVGGICTRQLPDAVVLLFRLDYQNLGGLARVARDIRSEPAKINRGAIDLHFVPSNVPNEDDEDGILDRHVREFGQQLGYAHPAATISHYSSLDMLEHTVFTLERPKTRLSKQYRSLLSSIIKSNIEDSEGAFAFLASAEQSRAGLVTSELETRFSKIFEVHGKDPKILARLSRIRERQGRMEEALELASDAIAIGAPDSEVLLRRAELRLRENDKAGAVADARRILSLSPDSDIVVSRAVELLRHIEPTNVDGLIDTPALVALKPGYKSGIAADLGRNVSELRAAEWLLKSALKECDTELTDRIINQLACVLIGLGKFDEAVELVTESDRPAESFNLAIATWGQEQRIPKQLFQRMLEIVEGSDLGLATANNQFCLALAHWAVGDVDSAKEHVERSKQLAMARFTPDISPWRYRLVGRKLFMDDIHKASAMLSGEDTGPEFLSYGTEESQ